jgi:hypothetical protein
MARARTIPAAPQARRQPGWAETRTSARIADALNYCRTARDLGVVFGGAGLGKTSTARRYAEATPGVLLCSMTPETASSAAALEEALAACGLTEFPSGAARMRRELARRLEGEGGLLIVDEAQHLSLAGLESFRCLHDQVGCGLVFVGNSQVYSRLSGGSRAASFAQLYSRVGMHLELTRPHKADVEAVAATWGVTAAPELAALWKLAQTPGALRLVCKTLALAARDADGAGVAVSKSHLESARMRLGGQNGA